MEDIKKEKGKKKNEKSIKEVVGDIVKEKKGTGDEIGMSKEAEEALENPLKIEIGKRFRKFREEIKKAQHELAGELNIYQSTITNIERGKTFPNIRYLQHFYKKYQLNINWLLTNEGDMLIFQYHTNPNALSVMDCHLNYNDPKYLQYAELFNYMQVPEVEQVVLSRLTESKALFKEQIADFFAKQQAKESENI